MRFNLFIVVIVCGIEICWMELVIVMVIVRFVVGLVNCMFLMVDI